jgi:hypothetical protein
MQVQIAEGGEFLRLKGKRGRAASRLKGSTAGGQYVASVRSHGVGSLTCSPQWTEGARRRRFLSP